MLIVNLHSDKLPEQDRAQPSVERSFESVHLSGRNTCIAMVLYKIKCNWLVYPVECPETHVFVAHLFVRSNELGGCPWCRGVDDSMKRKKFGPHSEINTKILSFPLPANCEPGIP